MIALSVQLEGMQSRADRSWKLTFGTNELTPEQIGNLGQMQQNICFIGISPNPFTSEQEKIISTTKAEIADNGKTPSERLRGVLYVKWKNQSEGYENFHDYYIVKMEAFITHIKNKLPK